MGTEGRNVRVSEEAYRICGGRRLHGTVTVGGAKNAIGKQLVASLLTSEPCTFANVPRIAEIDAILEMLADIGTQREWLDAATLRLQTRGISRGEVGQKYSGFNRIPILLLGPLLHRIGTACVPTVGGCRIGPRPVNFHLDALAGMGADVETLSTGYRATSRGLRGTTITLPYPSVGATETALFTATLAKGTTVIAGAAIEPEIIDTILFLQKMGAQISVDVDRRIVVEGVDRLHGVHHAPIPDRIEVASFAAAAIATRGEITVRSARQDHMTALLNALRKVGGAFTVSTDGITFFRRKEELTPLHLETDVHPGFMTDWQQPFVVMLTQAGGVSVVHETVYENRFGYTSALTPMGADITLTPFCLGSLPCRFAHQGHDHSCLIKGGTRLEGAPITIPDLRAGFAYIIAALTAHGTSEVTGIPYLERGYADVPRKLEAIGAQIEVVDHFGSPTEADHPLAA